MAIAKITGQGLTSIAVLVALLWACAISQRVFIARANQGTAEALREMRALRLENRPAAAPALPAARRLHPKRG